MDDATRELDELSGTLDAVEAAMARLNDGTYGRCEESGEPLKELLAGAPAAVHCGRCAQTSTDI